MGCATSSTQAPLVDWVLNPPADNSAEYWGVGEGQDLDSARRTALRSIASKIRVSVSGSMQSQTSVQNETVNRTAQSRVSEVVQETEFSHVTVEKSSKTKDVFYALVKVDRRAFVKETQAKFNELTRIIEQQLFLLEQKSALEQFQLLRSALPNIEKAITYGQLLRIADTTFRDGGKLALLESMRLNSSTAASKLVFSLAYKKDDSDIAVAIGDFLNSTGIRVSPSEQKLILKIDSVHKQEILFGSKSYNIQINLQLQNEKMDIVASKEYKINGHSLDTFASARQDAVRRLTQTMKSSGVSDALGL